MDACNALIVDDEADIRELIEMTLLPLGVTCAIQRPISARHTLCLKITRSAFVSLTYGYRTAVGWNWWRIFRGIIPICRWR